MIRIEVTAYDGQPPAQALAAEFDELGGTIGRAEGNTLVLPDPKRYISRTQASVIFRAGSYVLRDIGSASPVIVNGKQLGIGREAPIREGDVVSIASYTMRVVAAGPKSASVAASMSPIPSSSPVKDDPLAAFGADTSGNNPFADLLPPASAPPPRIDAAPPKGAEDMPRPRPPDSGNRANDLRQQPDVIPKRGEDASRRSEDKPRRLVESTPPSSPVASTPASLTIPEDFDPFAEPIPETPAPADKRLELIDLGPGTREQNIDDIFDLAHAEGRDPFGAGPLAEPRDDPDASPLLDPLVAIGASRPKKLPDAVQRDDAPEIYGSLRLSPVAPERLSPVAPERLPPVAPERLPPVAPERGPEVEPDVAPAPAKLPPASSQSPDSATTEVLLREFLNGTGMPNLHIPGGLTPSLARLLGQLFRESTQGTLDLLLARTTSKRELRSPVTTIVARENNPLKFSPSVEAAMTHLLRLDHVTGFMAPLPALKDAYDDLRAHEFGVMAGMRAALAGALARFDPSRLERRLAQKPVLDALLPINRDAKLWALFGELYADISREAEDNFHSVFGAEFLKAYEEQIAKLEQEEGNRND